MCMFHCENCSQLPKGVLTALLCLKIISFAFLSQGGKKLWFV